MIFCICNELLMHNSVSRLKKKMVQNALSDMGFR